MSGKQWHRIAAERIAMHQKITRERGDSEACYNGHLGCSTNGREGGPCLDEACHEVEAHEAREENK